MPPVEPIDPEWVKKYIDDLLAAAQKIAPGAFRDAIVSRAEHVLDMVEAWKNRPR